MSKKHLATFEKEFNNEYSYLNGGEKVNVEEYLSDDDVLYNGNTLGTVFSSNSKANRMILEFVLITK